MSVRRRLDLVVCCALSIGVLGSCSGASEPRAAPESEPHEEQAGVELDEAAPLHTSGVELDAGGAARARFELDDETLDPVIVFAATPEQVRAFDAALPDAILGVEPSLGVGDLERLDAVPAFEDVDPGLLPAEDSLVVMTVDESPRGTEANVFLAYAPIDLDVVAFDREGRQGEGTLRVEVAEDLFDAEAGEFPDITDPFMMDPDFYNSDDDQLRPWGED